MINVSGLRCDAIKNPLGISYTSPRLSWILTSDKRAVKQDGFKVEVWEEVYQNGKTSRTIYYDSGFIGSADNFLILPNIFTKSRTRYYWTVTVIDNYGNESKSMEDAWFENGILNKQEWDAKWIEPKQVPVYPDRKIPAWGEPKQSHEIEEDKLNPCPILRRKFRIEKTVQKARVYATAHGLYRLMINGKRVGNYELAPEATPYLKYLQVQTYDITELLETGENVLAAVLADGWWAGRVGYYGDTVQYGDKLGLLIQMEILYEDGTIEKIVSDKSFKSSYGGWRYADLEIGEKYDMNYEKKGWTLPSYNDKEWHQVEEVDYPLDNLMGQNARHIQVVETVACQKIYTSPRNQKIIDLGQVMAGTATMKLKGQPGAVITLRYFEEPDKEGNYFLELDGRHSNMTDSFVLDESGEGIYDPWFTYHGFRYIYISSDKGKVEAENIIARLYSSEEEVTARIITSNEKLNRLQKNIQWTLQANMMSILTDNPDRERGGWTGDLEMIAPTLCYNLESQAFLRRWLKETQLEQKENGEVPLVVPNWHTYAALNMSSSSAGWGDVVELLPWILYKRYGDKRILEENYAMMKNWVAFQTKRAAEANPEGYENLSPERKERLKYIWNADWNFGDWLTPSACYNEETGEYVYYTQTLCYMMGAYYHAYASRTMVKIAEVLGYKEDAHYYGELYEKIRKAAIEEIYHTGGILESEYMGAQILALHMGFYPTEDKEKLINRIIELIEERGLDVGFSSALLIEELLCENGYSEKAYDFLLNEKFPSWLYEVNQGATSIWESMQAIMPDGTRNAVSFIQPAFGTIGNWMMQGMGGIRPASPGFKQILIHPYMTERLSFVMAEYNSVQGKIACHWKYNAGKNVVLELHIPVNSTAQIFLPDACREKVLESGLPVDKFEGLISVKEEEGGLLVEVASGHYCFAYDLDI